MVLQAITILRSDVKRMIIGRVTSDSKSEKEFVPKDLVFDLTQPSILYIKMVRPRVGSYNFLFTLI